MRLYIGPWQWDNLQGWIPPQGTVDLIDLRTNIQASIKGPDLLGSGLFITETIIDDPLYTQIASDPDEIILGKYKDELTSQFYLRKPIIATRLIDILKELLMDHAIDPNVLCPPFLLPDNQRILKFKLGPIVYKARFDEAMPEWPEIQKVLQGQYRKVLSDVEAKILPDDFNREILTVWVEQYKLDFTKFIPSDLPVVEPLPHKTLITESFTTADSNTLGPDLTWTELSGDWDIVSNQAQLQDLATEGFARAESILSSANHSSKIRHKLADNLMAQGAAARFAAAASTFYHVSAAYGGGTATQLRLRKVIAGTPTQLAITTITQSPPEIFKLICNGTTIDIEQAGVNRINQSDSAIDGITVGGLYTGIYGYSDNITIGKPTMDQFESEDLAAGPDPPLLTNISPTSAYSNATNDVTLLDVVITGTALDGTTPVLTPPSGWTIVGSPVITSTTITFDVTIPSGETPGNKTFDFETDDGSDTINMAISNPIGTVGGGDDDMYLGFNKIDDTLTFTIQCKDADGNDSDADSVPSYRVYENETGTPILTGTMAKLDDSNTLGFYSEQITLSAANGLEVGKSYSIRINFVIDTVNRSALRAFSMIAPLTLADFFTVDSSKVYADAIDGSLVKEITASAIAAISAALSAFPFKKNVGTNHVPFFMRDTTNTLIGKTGTPTITRSLDGGAFGAITGGTVTDLGGGSVDYVPSAADCNATLCRYKATLAGAVTAEQNLYAHA